MVKIDKILLVEGTDDKHVITNLCGVCKVPETFKIIDCKGVDSLKDQIPVRFKESGINTIGMIVDADVDLNARWQSIKQILTVIGFDMPEDLPKTGLIIDNGHKKVGVWIMPDNNINGMLEDFIAFLVPSNDLLLPIVHSTLESIEAKGLNKYATIHKSKAIIHSWLALQEDPGKPLGQSITKKYLTTNEETCNKLTKWLIELFSDNLHPLESEK